LSARLAKYSSPQSINNHTDKSAKIYLLFIGRRAYYCEREYFHDSGDLPGYLLAVIRAAKTPEQIDQGLKRQGITHLIVREDLLTEFLTQNLTPDQAAIWNLFAQAQLTLVFRDRGHAVYQLHG